MGRTKIQRSYSFKPKYKEFIPSGLKGASKIKLNHDEIEALFLMDYQNMYQEDAAKLMNVSRPTFSRIVKSARQKVATALVCGASINLEDDMNEYIVAFCYSDDSYSSIVPIDENIMFVKFIDSNIVETRSIKNPLNKTDQRPATFLASFFSDNDVNFFISSKIGEGLKNSLLTKGIYSIKIDKLRNIEDIVYLVDTK